MNSSQRRLLFLSSIGGVLEFYDFIIFALLANYIAQEFFPTGNEITALISAFATFSVGYLVRPLGGILFGHYGDRYGRKSTFTFSILMMALATIGIGLIPYEQIGIAAPIILSILRILQGISIGGEIPGAIAYVCESIPERKGTACGIIFCAILNGIVLGTFALALLNSLLTQDEILSFGWRIPFLAGGLFGLASYRMRLDLEESSLFKRIMHKTEQYPALVVCKNQTTEVMMGFINVGLLAAIITLLFLFTPSYISHILKLNLDGFLWWQTGAIFIATLLTILFGALTDTLSHRKLMITLCLSSIIGGAAIFYIYTTAPEYYLIALALSALLAGFATGVIPNVLSDFFPTQVRYSGIAISYNIGFALFGGLTPLIAASLIYRTESLFAPYYYLLGTAMLVLLMSLVFGVMGNAGIMKNFRNQKRNMGMTDH